MLEEMKAEGGQDLLGEGIRPEKVSYALEFEMSGKGAPSAPVACRKSAKSAKDLEGALRTAANAPSGPIALDLIRLRVKKQMPKPRLTQQPLQAADSSHAHVGKRGVFWGSRTGERRRYIAGNHCGRGIGWRLRGGRRSEYHLFCDPMAGT